MLIFLTSNNADGTLTFATTVIIAIIAAIGAGLRIFTSLKNKKVKTNSLEDLVNSIYQDTNIMNILKTIFTDECFKNSNTYEEFVDNISKVAQEKLYNYMVNNATFIPANLLQFVTLENMGYVAQRVLEYFGYDYEKLSEMFEDYIVDTITESPVSVEEVEDAIFATEQIIAEETVEEAAFVETVSEETTTVEEIIEEEN